MKPTFTINQAVRESLPVLRRFGPHDPFHVTDVYPRELVDELRYGAADSGGFDDLALLSELRTLLETTENSMVFLWTALLLHRLLVTTHATEPADVLVQQLEKAVGWRAMALIDVAASVYGQLYFDPLVLDTLPPLEVEPSTERVAEAVAAIRSLVDDDAETAERRRLFELLDRTGRSRAEDLGAHTQQLGDLIESLRARGELDLPLPGTSDPALVAAARWGLAGAMTSLLAAGADVGSRGECGFTALMAAAADGHDDLVVHLLANGAEVDLLDDLGRSALMWASSAANRSYRTIHRLLDAGADAGIISATGETVVDYALVDPELYQLLADLAPAVLTLPRGVPSVEYREGRVKRPGAKGFLDQQLESHPEWAVMMIAAEIVAVTDALAEQRDFDEVVRDVGDKALRAARWMVWVLQCQGEPWTIVLPLSAFHEDVSRNRSLMNAQELSARLKAEVLEFVGEDTSESWELRTFQAGRKVDRLQGEVYSPGGLQGAGEFFASSEAFLPACEASRQGLRARLVLHGLRPEDVRRIDYLAVRAWSGST